LARQERIGDGQVMLLGRLDNLEIEMQSRCCKPRALDGDNAKRIRRVRQHRDPATIFARWSVKKASTSTNNAATRA
jgi:hypothetical protein